MRTEFLLLAVLFLAGCQSATPVPPPPATPVVASTSPTTSAADPMLRQRRHIEALIAQNEALTARVRELEMPPKPVPAKDAPGPASPVVPVAKNIPALRFAEPEPALLPNADGVLDLAALRAGDESNPFAVRSVAPESVREIALRLDGLVHGPVSCAVVNGRTVQAGDRIESLDVVRVEQSALLLRHGGELLRLPLSEKPIRIRLPL